MATAVVSGRVDEAIRQRADIAMRKANLTPTDVIQGVWAAMAKTGEVPDIARPVDAAPKEQKAMARLDRFLNSLPPVNSAYEGWSDDDILALRACDE